MSQKASVNIDRAMYHDIPKDIALFIEKDALEYQSMNGIARKAATTLYRKLMEDHRDFANYLIGMYGQVNIAQEKKIADLTRQLKTWEENWNRDNGYPDNSKAVISKLKEDIQKLTGELILEKQKVRVKNERIEKLQACVKYRPIQDNISVDFNDGAPITVVRRMVVKIIERADGTSTVQHESSDMPMMIAIGVLDTLRVKFVSEAARKFNESKTTGQ